MTVKTSDKAKPTELSECEVNEISLVHKAANKHKLLITKSDEAPPVPEATGEAAADGEASEPVKEEVTKDDTAPEPAPEPEAQATAENETTPVDVEKQEYPDEGKKAPKAKAKDKEKAMTVTKATHDALVSVAQATHSLLLGTDIGDANSPEFLSHIEKAFAPFAEFETAPAAPAPEVPDALAPALAKIEKASKADIAKAATGAAARLIEIAASLGIDTEEMDGSYTYDVKYRICDVLDALTTLSNLERMEPAAAKMVADSVGAVSVEKSDDSEVAPSAEEAAKEANEKFAVIVKKAAAFAPASAAAPETFDLEGVEKLVTGLTSVLKSQREKIAKLESATQFSNALPVEETHGAPSRDVWREDMASESNTDITF